MTLSLTTLGGFAVRDSAGTVLPLPTRKTRALLGYLAFYVDQAHSREKLATLLWGDHGDKQARHSLNQSLGAIRKLGLDSCLTLLQTDMENVRLAGDALEIDVVRLRSLLKTNPLAAAAQYRGLLMEGLSIVDPGYEEWLAAARSELHGLVCMALERAATEVAHQGRTNEAITAARRLVELDPLHEGGHRLLMRLQFEAGDRTGAIRQYRACADLLKSELQVDPDTETRALFEKIRAGSVINATISAPTPHDTRLPNKPSIAILAFENMSGDPEQETFAHGMAEDITTRLVQRADMQVVARKSSFTYKDRSVTAQQIGRELGVRYLLEGSIQKTGGDTRVTAQLIDVATGRHIWAQSYDRKLRNLFAVQDEIARDVAIELAVNLTEGEMARYHSKGTDNAEAYDYFLRGRAAFIPGRKELMIQAACLLEKAIELDPQYARAIAWLGLVRYMQQFLGWADDQERALKQVEQLARRAIAIDKNCAYGYTVLSKVHLFRREYDKAIAAGRRAIEFEPGNAAHYGMLAHTSIIAGLLQEASELVEEMLRLAPRPPVQVLGNESWVHYLSGRYEETISACQKLLAQSANTESGATCYRMMIASYMALGREPDARAVARTHMEKFPGFSLRRHAKVLESRPYKDPSWIDVHIDRLRRADLPD